MASVRKRATNVVGALSVSLADAPLHHMVESLLSRIESSSSAVGEGVRTFISTIGMVSSSVGYRMGAFLPRVLPLFVRFCGDPDDEALQTDQGNDLRETCLLAFESFVLRCPSHVTAFVDRILKVGGSGVRVAVVCAAGGRLVCGGRATGVWCAVGVRLVCGGRASGGARLSSPLRRRASITRRSAPTNPALAAGSHFSQLRPQLLVRRGGGRRRGRGGGRR